MWMHLVRLVADQRISSFLQIDWLILLVWWRASAKIVLRDDGIWHHSENCQDRQCSEPSLRSEILHGRFAVNEFGNCQIGTTRANDTRRLSRHLIQCRP